jgi:hypothetical protein
MQKFKNVTIIEMKENFLVLENGNQIQLHYISNEGISTSLVIPIETIYLALSEYLAIHSLNASKTSAFISNETSLM